MNPNQLNDINRTLVAEITHVFYINGLISGINILKQNILSIFIYKESSMDDDEDDEENEKKLKSNYQKGSEEIGEGEHRNQNIPYPELHVINLGTKENMIDQQSIDSVPVNR